MGRVGRSRCKVDEEGFVRRERLLEFDPRHGLVGHVFKEVIVGIVRQLDRVDPIVDEGRPLVRFTAQKAIELVEALSRGPAVVGTRDGRFPCCRLMPLPEGSRAVAIEAEDLRQWRNVVRDHPGVAGKCRGGFRNAAHVVHVVVAPALQRGACRRTNGGRVEVDEAHPFGGERVELGSRYRAAEGRGPGETEIVHKHDQHIRRVVRRCHLKERWHGGVAHVQHAELRRWRIGDRQRSAVHLVLGNSWLGGANQDGSQRHSSHQGNVLRQGSNHRLIPSTTRGKMNYTIGHTQILD